MLRRDHRGAVTVFVTLLLIPAILISGTGVDISRIYAARSTARDANQLAANALLTNYDALLQDLYGLYAVIGDDAKLTDMVDRYVQISLFGEPGAASASNQWTLYTNQDSAAVSAAGMDPLSDVAVLRRQIEEYSKYRVPVAIVSDILDRLQNDESKEMAANNRATVKKIAVDEKLNELIVQIKEIQDKADQIHKDYVSAESSLYSAINGSIGLIDADLRTLLEIQKEFEELTDMNDGQDLKDHFDAVLENIRITASVGGKRGRDWIPAHIDDNGHDVAGTWGSTDSYDRVPLKDMGDMVEEQLGGYKSQLDGLWELCKTADLLKNDLRTSISELEMQLNSGQCTKELADEMKKEIETYKELLEINFSELGKANRDKGVNYIDNTAVPPVKDMQGYGVVGVAFFSFDVLGEPSRIHGFQIDFHTNIGEKYQGRIDYLQKVQGCKVLLTAPGGFLPFQEISPEHEKCYQILNKLHVNLKSEGEALSEEEKSQKSNFTMLFRTMKDLWNGITDYDATPGQEKYSGEIGNWAFQYRERGMEMDFGLGDFSPNNSDDSSMRDTIKTFTNLVTGKSDTMDVFSNALSNGANRVLLTGYATQMFSNWSFKYTYKDKDAPLSLTGQPIDGTHNFFYNAELEYLLNGKLDAAANLQKVSFTILCVRFLVNYAASYMLVGVNGEINSMKAAVAAIPFAGGALQFLVRPLYALGESAWDLAMLRTGHGVPLLKKQDKEWSFWMGGAVTTLVENAKPEKSNNLNAEEEKKKGLLYSDYLTVFLLVSEPDVIAARIGDLIALNVGMVKNRDSDASPELFDLSKSHTTFSIQTDTEVRFLFLALPVAQKGVNGIIPSRSFPISVTDYRGY